MKSVEFCYWLQGLFELGNPVSLNEQQTLLIKKHLNMVFVHEIDGSYPQEQQKALSDAHNNKYVGLDQAWDEEDQFRPPRPSQQYGVRC